MIIKYPWQEVNDTKVIELDDNKWILPVAFDKGIPTFYIKNPGKEIEDKIKVIYDFLHGSRNFLLVISNRTAYTNSLFYYLGLTWMTSLNKTFDIVDIGNIDKNNRNDFFVMETTSLLIAPFVNADSYSLRDVRDRVGAILIKRQVRKMPTIVEIYSRKPPNKLTEPETVGLLTSISSLYGERCASTFLDKDSNVKIIKLK